MGTVCVIVNPPASCATLTGVADGGNNGLAIVGVLAVRRAAGAQPRAMARVSHGIPRQIAFMPAVLLHARIFHSSFVYRHRYRMLLVWLRCCGRSVARDWDGDLRHRLSVHITVNPAEQAAADFVFRVAAWHQLGEPIETLLSPLV